MSQQSLLARLGEQRREIVQHGRPYLGGAAAVLALLAVAVAGYWGALLGAALIVALFAVRRELDRRVPDAAPQPTMAEADESEATAALGTSNTAHFDARLAASQRTLDFGQTLAQLVGLVDRRVQVMLAAGADPWAVGEIHGTLAIGRDISDEQTDEMMLFRVDGDDGDVAGAFAMPSAQFFAGVGLDDSRNPGVAFRAGGSVVWVFDEGDPEDYHRRHGHSSETSGEGER